MHGVVTILPEPHNHQVQAIWDELETKHGLKGIRVTPYPHFSWQIGEQYDQEKMEAALNRIAVQTRPFMVRTTGLGIFSGPAPVVFISVVKNAALVELHRQVWDALEPVTSGGSPFYSPDFWVPHISIAYADLTEHNTGPVVETLAFRTYNWEFLVDNFAFIYEPVGSIGEMTVKQQFGG